jgi:hypothetical protein
MQGLTQAGRGVYFANQAQFSYVKSVFANMAKNTLVKWTLSRYAGVPGTVTTKWSVYTCVMSYLRLCKKMEG